MKTIETKYKCDGCHKDITRKKDVILLSISHLSGIGKPPFTTSTMKPLFIGKPDLHLCSFKCSGVAIEGVFKEAQKAVKWSSEINKIDKKLHEEHTN